MVKRILTEEERNKDKELVNFIKNQDLYNDELFIKSKIIRMLELNGSRSLKKCKKIQYKPFIYEVNSLLSGCIINSDGLIMKMSLQDIKTPWGRAYVKVDVVKEGTFIYIYKSHFFDRYALRSEAMSKMTRLQVLKEYLKAELTARAELGKNAGLVKTDAYGNFLTLSEEGVCLGTKYAKEGVLEVAIFKTFLNYDQINKDRMEEVEMMEMVMEHDIDINKINSREDMENIMKSLGNTQ